MSKQLLNIKKCQQAIGLEIYYSSVDLFKTVQWSTYNLVTQILNGNVDTLNKIDLTDYKYIIGFNEERKHWRLFFANMNEKLFYYLDPFKASVKEKQEKFNSWKNFLSARHVTDAKSWKQGKFEQSQQTDNFNCGVIALMFLETLLANQTQLEFTDKSLVEYRVKLNGLLDKYNKPFPVGKYSKLMFL